MRCDECLQKIPTEDLYILKYKIGSEVLIIPCKCSKKNRLPLSQIARTGALEDEDTLRRLI